MNKIRSVLAASAFFLSAVAHAGLVLDLGPGRDARGCEGCGTENGMTFGWAFDVSSAITVDGLGVWDASANGIGPAVDVGFWDSNGALLASATVTDGSSTEASAGNGVWLFEDIAALLLTPGEYVIGSVFFDSAPLAQFFTAVITIPEVSYLGDRNGPTDAGLQFPDNTEYSGGIFGPTLRLAEAQVPEPASLTLLGLGLLCLVVFQRGYCRANGIRCSLYRTP